MRSKTRNQTHVVSPRPLSSPLYPARSSIIHLCITARTEVEQRIDVTKVFIAFGGVAHQLLLANFGVLLLDRRVTIVVSTLLSHSLSDLLPADLGESRLVMEDRQAFFGVVESRRWDGVGVIAVVLDCGQEELDLRVSVTDQELWKVRKVATYISGLPFRFAHSFFLGFGESTISTTKC